MRIESYRINAEMYANKKIFNSETSGGFVDGVRLGKGSELLDEPLSMHRTGFRCAEGG